MPCFSNVPLFNEKVVLWCFVLRVHFLDRWSCAPLKHPTFNLSIFILRKKTFLMKDFFNKTMCAKVIGTPRNDYEQNVTSIFSIYIWLFKVDHSELPISNPSLLVSMGYKYEVVQSHIPFFIHQHGKNKRTHKSNEGNVCCASLVRERI